VIQIVEPWNTCACARAWKNSDRYLGFQDLAAVVMQSTIFWDITSYSPFNVNRRYAGTYRLHLQVRISRARYHREKQVARLPHAFPKDGGDMFLRNIR
jgi:hypothetical protein